MTGTRKSRSFLLSAALTRAGFVALRANPPGRPARWERTNYAGRTVELHAGPAVAVGTALAAARVRPAARLAVLAAGACRAYDDVVSYFSGDTRRGFRPTSAPCATAKSPAAPSSWPGSPRPPWSRARC